MWATRMICGRCSRETNYGTKPCPCGNLMGKSRSTAHWEGGKGARDRSKLSNKDTHKMKGLNKTVSNKAKHNAAQQGKADPSAKVKAQQSNHGRRHG